MEITLTKGERTQATLLEAAYSLFVQQGYAGTSMRQIAQEANLALGGIYNHFGNKEDIFKAVVFTYHPVVLALPRIVALETDDFESFITAAMRAIMAEVDERAGIFNLMFIELTEFNGRHIPELMQRVMPAIAAFQQRVTAAHAELRIHTPAVVLQTLVGTLLGYVLTHQMFRQSDLPVPLRGVHIDDFSNVYLRGVLKRP